MIQLGALTQLRALTRSFGVALVCLLGACSAPEPLPRLRPAEALSDARELDVVWVGAPEGDGPLLVLLHGYGAPANDLVPFARSLRQRTHISLRVALPGAPIDMGRGRAWWLIEQGARPADRSGERPNGITAARRDIEHLIRRWRREGLSTPGRTSIAGFSQGGMLAMEVGLRSDPPLAGIGNLSGGALEADGWVALASSAPPIFASHGRRDPLLSFDAAARLRERLDEAGAEVTWLPFEGAHEIPPIVRSGLVDFLRHHALGSGP